MSVSGLVEAVGSVDSRWLLLAFLGALDAWAIALVLTSRAGGREKALWVAVILLCPIVGCLLWYVLGPKPNLVREERGEPAAGARDRRPAG